MHQISLNNVGHSFENVGRKIELFSDIKLQVKQGKSYSIVGPSGTGKSSLLSLIAGLEQPKHGTVNYKIGSSTQCIQTLRKESGFIFQQFHLIPELDALNNIALPLKLYGDKNATQKAHALLHKVGLPDRAAHKPCQLSGGEQQRVAIARAFIREPKFIFADEPTGNLDESTARIISQLLFDFIKAGKSSLVLVTHCEALAEQTDFRFQLKDGFLEAI